MRGLQQLGGRGSRRCRTARARASLLTSSCSLHAPRSIEAAMARLLAMVLRTRADRPASPQRFEGADPLSCASDGCRPAGSALQTGPRAAAVKHPNWSAARAHGPLLYETGTTWRAEASRRGLRPAQAWRSPPRPTNYCGLSAASVCCHTSCGGAGVRASGPRATAENHAKNHVVSAALRESTATGPSGGAYRRLVRTLGKKKEKKRKKGDVRAIYPPEVRLSQLSKLHCRRGPHAHLPLSSIFLSFHR